LLGTALPFRYNHIEELKAIVDRYPDELAAVVMEPIRNAEPIPGFLERVRQLCDEIGAVLLIDEISAGFRLNTGGAHLLYGLKPDIAVFAKAISNGFPMAAIIGKGEVMQAAQSTFISSTYWTDRVGPAAALATVRKFQRCDVSRHLIRSGEMVRNGWQLAAERAGLSIDIGGIAPMSHFAIKSEQSQAVHTLFTQIMLEKGFLAGKAFYATYAHKDHILEEYLQATQDAFATLALAIERGTVVHMLRGPQAHTGFTRLN
jgi:glutamate-1-semialdehyde aminotransferase